MEQIQTEKGPMNKLMYKVGLPSNLFWGFIGLLIFMGADGVENGWISPYLVDHGFSVGQVSALLTVYGVSIAIAAWFSGVLFEIIGPRKTILLGLLLYVIGSVTFVYFGMMELNLTMMYPTYAIRGLGYPTVAYSFLIWLNYSTPKDILGKAVGWYWFAYSGGLFVTGAFASAALLPVIGEINTMWLSAVIGIVGVFFLIVLNRDAITKSEEYEEKTSAKEEFKDAVAIVKDEPKVVIGTVLKILNGLVPYSFAIFLPLHMTQHGYELTEWLSIWGSIFTANIFFNLIIGFISDKIGWQKTIQWIGCTGIGITGLLLYYMPLIAPGNTVLLYIIAMIFGMCLAGFVPLSALVPAVAGEKKGAALALFNLGGGVARFIGPALIGLFTAVFGTGGIIWCMAALYFIGAILANFLKIGNLGTSGNIEYKKA